MKRCKAFGYSLLIALLSLPAISAAQGDLLLGHFRSLEKNDTLRIWHSGEAPMQTKWLQIFKASRWVDAVSADVLTDGYERISLIKMCKDEDSGLDQFIFSRSNSGTAWGDRENILFVYFSPSKQGFATMDVDGHFYEGSCSRQAIRQRIRQSDKLRDAGRRLYKRIRPHWQGEQVAFDMASTKKWFAEANRKLTPSVGQGDWTGIDAASFHLERMVENRRWKVVLVYFEESMFTSWGVLLARDKQAGIWRTIYEVPNHGGSKRYLYLPDDIQLDGDRLQLDLCTDCTGWGKYKTFSINLGRMGED